MLRLIPARSRSRFLVYIYSFFDESGKFHDHSVVSFGGVCGRESQIAKLDEDWEALLRSVGRPSLSMKEALKHQFALGDRVQALGATERNTALLPFVECIKHNCELILGTAIDVAAFGAMSPEAHKQLTRDPYYASFARNILEVLAYLGDSDSAINIICDDDESTAEQTLKLYRKVKLVHDRRRFPSISFADDKFFPSLQAADVVSSLIRLEGRKQFFGEEYDYASLYERVVLDLRTVDQAAVHVGIFGANTMSKLSGSYDGIAKEYPNHGKAPLVGPRTKKKKPFTRQG